MTLEPLVSVVIPAYNCAPYISATLESVLAQTYESVEVIVVDDGSTDDTLSIVQRYPSVRVISQANGGLSNARNTGIVAARGEFIALLDGDDIWPHDKLQEQIKIIKQHPKIGLLFGNAKRFSDNGWIEEPLFERYGFDATYFGHEYWVRDAVPKLLRVNFIPVGTVIVLKRWLVEAGLFDENFRRVEDWDMWLRMALRYPFAYSSQVWKLKRVHSTNLSNDTEAMTKTAIAVMQKLKREYSVALEAHQANLKPHLRDAYRNLGYFYLRQLRLDDAKKAFRRGLSFGFDFRTATYLAATFTGQGVVRSVIQIRG